MRSLASLALAGLLAACAPSSSSPSALPDVVAPSTSAATSPSSAATPPSTSPTPVMTPYPTPAELARKHAPLCRFSAWVPGITSIANKSEDYFPGSVRGYLDELASGSARVITQEADAAAVGVSEVKALPARPVIHAGEIDGAPWGLPGDEPGTAPIYFHLYGDTQARVRNPDGSGSDTIYIEYWIFYGQDASREQLAFGGPVFDLGGHEGDWEHTTFAIRVDLGAGGSFLSSRIVEGYYSAHDDRYLVDLADIQLVDDQGSPDPQGTHPTSFVSVGKHAEYAQGGYWIDMFGLLPLVIHDEFFLGAGFAWSTWQSTLHDLDDRSAIAEFAPASFASLLDPALAGAGLTDWRDYGGTWGDSTSLALFGKTLPFGGSPGGPWTQSDYGAGPKCSRRWSDTKLGAQGLTILAVPPVVPPPVPIPK